MKAKLLLVEDDIHINDGLTELLFDNEYMVDSVGSVKDAKECVSNNIYDLIILDISLPDGDGLDLCAKWRKEKLETPILFLTASDEEFQIVKGLDAGGDDYITKPFRLLELLSRIRALIRRNNKTVIKHDGIKIDLGNFNVNKDGKALYLTQIEFQLLAILISNNGQVLERKQLLKKIWDDDSMFIEDNTLSVHMSRLREKIGPSYIKTIRGVGYKWEDDI
ncbi:MAG: response regulator transcription factor [Proteobacteria bacterium]|nr:response regulator transcription factor [Pseudomonadota bacterium]